MKSTSKFFFVSRLRGKKYKINNNSKVLQDTSNTLDTSQASTPGPQKVDDHSKPATVSVQQCLCYNVHVFACL